MWRALAIAVALTGCGRLFGLDPPVRDDGIKGDAGRRDDAPSSGDGPMGDGPPETDGGNALCPASYTTTLGTSPSRYRIVTNMAIAWDGAQTQCLNDQIVNSTRYTHLVVGASDVELIALDTAVSNEIWIGLSDRAIEGAYQWVTQENNNYPPASGGPWSTSEPKASINEDCVRMNTNGGLEIQSCTLGKQFVCECDAFPNDPTKY